MGVAHPTGEQNRSSLWVTLKTPARPPEKTDGCWYNAIMADAESHAMVLHSNRDGNATAALLSERALLAQFIFNPGNFDGADAQAPGSCGVDNEPNEWNDPEGQQRREEDDDDDEINSDALLTRAAVIPDMMDQHASSSPAIAPGATTESTENRRSTSSSPLSPPERLDTRTGDGDEDTIMDLPSAPLHRLPLENHDSDAREAISALQRPSQLPRRISTTDAATRALREPPPRNLLLYWDLTSVRPLQRVESFISFWIDHLVPTLTSLGFLTKKTNFLPHAFTIEGDPAGRDTMGSGLLRTFTRLCINLHIVPSIADVHLELMSKVKDELIILESSNSVTKHSAMFSTSTAAPAGGENGTARASTHPSLPTHEHQQYPLGEEVAFVLVTNHHHSTVDFLKRCGMLGIRTCVVFDDKLSSSIDEKKEKDRQGMTGSSNAEQIFSFWASAIIPVSKLLTQMRDHSSAAAPGTLARLRPLVDPTVDRASGGIGAAAVYSPDSPWSPHRGKRGGGVGGESESPTNSSRSPSPSTSRSGTPPPIPVPAPAAPAPTATHHATLGSEAHQEQPPGEADCETPYHTVSSWKRPGEEGEPGGRARGGKNRGGRGGRGGTAKSAKHPPPPKLQKNLGSLPMLQPPPLGFQGILPPASASPHHLPPYFHNLLPPPPPLPAYGLAMNLALPISSQAAYATICESCGLPVSHHEPKCASCRTTAHVHCVEPTGYCRKCARFLNSMIAHQQSQGTRGSQLSISKGPWMVFEEDDELEAVERRGEVFLDEEDETDDEVVQIEPHGLGKRTNNLEANKVAEEGWGSSNAKDDAYSPASVIVPRLRDFPPPIGEDQPFNTNMGEALEESEPLPLTPGVLDRAPTATASPLQSPKRLSSQLQPETDSTSAESKKQAMEFLQEVEQIQRTGSTNLLSPEAMADLVNSHAEHPTVQALLSTAWLTVKDVALCAALTHADCLLLPDEPSPSQEASPSHLNGQSPPDKPMTNRFAALFRFRQSNAAPQTATKKSVVYVRAQLTRKLFSFLWRQLNSEGNSDPAHKLFPLASHEVVQLRREGLLPNQSDTSDSRHPDRICRSAALHYMREQAMALDEEGESPSNPNCSPPLNKRDQRSPPTSRRKVGIAPTRHGGAGSNCMEGFLSLLGVDSVEQAKAILLTADVASPAPVSALLSDRTADFDPTSEHSRNEVAAAAPAATAENAAEAPSLRLNASQENDSQKTLISAASTAPTVTPPSTQQDSHTQTDELHHGVQKVSDQRSSSSPDPVPLPASRAADEGSRPLAPKVEPIPAPLSHVVESNPLSCSPTTSRNRKTTASSRSLPQLSPNLSSLPIDDAARQVAEHFGSLVGGWLQELGSSSATAFNADAAKSFLILLWSQAALPEDLFRLRVSDVSLIDEGLSKKDLGEGASVKGDDGFARPSMRESNFEVLQIFWRGASHDVPTGSNRIGRQPHAAPSSVYAATVTKAEGSCTTLAIPKSWAAAIRRWTTKVLSDFLANRTPRRPKAKKISQETTTGSQKAKAEEEEEDPPRPNSGLPGAADPFLFQPLTHNLLKKSLYELRGADEVVPGGDGPSPQIKQSSRRSASPIRSGLFPGFVSFQRAALCHLLVDCGFTADEVALDYCGAGSSMRKSTTANSSLTTERSRPLPHQRGGDGSPSSSPNSLNQGVVFLKSELRKLFLACDGNPSD